MGSAIGDYIHAFGFNYVKYGTNKIGRGQSEHPAIALANTRNYLQNRIKRMGKSTKIEELEQELNNFLEIMGEDNPMSQENETLQAKGRELLLNLIGLEWDKAKSKVNWSNLDVSGARGLGSIKTSTQHYANRNKTYENIIIDRVQKLNNRMQQLSTTLSKSAYREGDLDRVNAEIKEVYKMATETKEYISDIIKNIMPGAKLNQDQRNLILRINELIATYAPFVDDSNKKGKLFEYFIQMANMAPEHIIETEMEELQQEFLNLNLGSKSNFAGYSRKNFIKGMTNKEKGALGWGSEMIDEYNSFTARTKWSQQKIDVMIDFHGEPQKISAKNVNLATKNGDWSKSKLISLTTGNPLLSMLQDESSAFVNHYFNLFAQQYDVPSSIAMAQFNAMRSGYIGTLKALLLYKAFTGAGEKKGMKERAEVFIINNNKAKTNKIKVFNIKDVLKDLDVINGSSKAIVKTDPNVLTPGYRYNNQYVPNNNSGTLRIRKMLFEAHAAKVHVQLKGGALLDAK